MAKDINRHKRMAMAKTEPAAAKVGKGLRAGGKPVVAKGKCYGGRIK